MCGSEYAGFRFFCGCAELQVSHSNNSSLLASPRWAAQSSAGSDGKPVALAPDVTCSGLLAAITARDEGSNTDIQVWRRDHSY
jgi:hypothetical protein